MIKLSALVDLVRPYVGDCPKILVERELLSSAREFCTKTKVWKDMIHVGFGARSNKGQLVAVDGQSFISITSVSKKDAKNFLSSADDVDHLPKDQGEPKFYSSEDPGILFIGPKPEEVFIAEVKLAIKPSLSGDEIPTFIAESWGDEIAHGAAARILLMPDTEWYNANQSQFHYGRFLSGINDAKSHSATGFSDGGQIAHGKKFI